VHVIPIILVPKLHLGMPLAAKLHFASAADCSSGIHNGAPANDLGAQRISGFFPAHQIYGCVQSEHEITQRSEMSFGRKSFHREIEVGIWAPRPGGLRAKKPDATDARDTTQYLHRTIYFSRDLRAGWQDAGGRHGKR